MKRYRTKGTITICLEVNEVVEAFSPDQVYIQLLRELTPPGYMSSVVRSGLTVVEVPNAEDN